VISNCLKRDVVCTGPARRGYSTKARNATKPAVQDDTDENRKERLMGGFSPNFQVLILCISTLVALITVIPAEERSSVHTGEPRAPNSTGEVAAPATDTDMENSQRDQKVFNSSEFTSFTIVESVSTNDRVGSQLIRLTVVPTSQSKQFVENPYDASWARGIWAFEFKEAEAGTTRMYIPWPPRLADPPSWRSSPREYLSSSLTFDVEKCGTGGVLRPLFGRRPGEEIQLRGPLPLLDLPREGVQEVKLVSADAMSDNAIAQASHCFQNFRVPHQWHYMTAIYLDSQYNPEPLYIRFLPTKEASTKDGAAFLENDIESKGTGDNPLMTAIGGCFTVLAGSRAFMNGVSYDEASNVMAWGDYVTDLGNQKVLFLPVENTLRYSAPGNDWS
jgi:hypothetical protein